jgi:RNA polymerase sigma-70 factor, ECF subfamily
MSATDKDAANTVSATDGRLPDALAAMYTELKRLARAQLQRERSDHTLSATALVHEAYIKLAAHHPEWNDKHHFMALASRAMRQTLVTYALAHRAEKRGGDWLKLTLTSSLPEIEQHSSIEAAQNKEDAEDVVSLDHALKSLEAVDPRQGKIVELRYFAGLSIEETAATLSLSPATIKREWSLARLYLKRAMTA